MYRVYMEIKSRGSGLTQLGYLKRTPGKVPGSDVLMLPFSLEDEIMSEIFRQKDDAERAVHEAVDALNFRCYESVKVGYEKVN